MGYIGDRILAVVSVKILEDHSTTGTGQPPNRVLTILRMLMFEGHLDPLMGRSIKYPSLILSRSYLL